MIERFQEEDGRRKLLEAILLQKCVHGASEMAGDLVEAVSLSELRAGDTLITQGAEDTDMFFLLTGHVDVMVNGRLVARRVAGEHVGEMALIDPRSRRSASVVARETTVVARVTETDLTRVAARHPTLWRYFALELANRLRERNQWHRPPNPRPVLFIGSSVESLAVAREIQSGLAHDKFVVRVWTDGVFAAGSNAIGDLMAQVRESDFALMVFSPDDKVVSRHKQSDAPRDNVVFELGLFMGEIGPERTFVVKPRGVALRVPTDLLGIKPLEYDPADPSNLTSAMAPVCHEIRKRIVTLNTK